jgi:signal transduction histidine kinase
MSRPWSIRWWLGIFTAAVTLPPLALLVWIFASQIQHEQDDARDAALRIARATAADMRALHRDSLDLLVHMSERPAIREFDGVTCDSLFAVVDFLPQFPDLLFFDRTGRLICSATPGSGEEAFARATQAWIAAELAAGRLRPGRPVIRSVAGRWVSAAAVEVRGRDGTARGTLVLAELPRIVGGAVLPQDAAVTIIDDEGVILARTGDPQRWVGRDVSATGVAALALRKSEGRAEAVGVDGVWRQYGFTDLPELGWHLYVGIPTSVVMQPVRSLLVRGLAGAVLVVAIVIGVASLFARYIVRPINAVARASHEMARGSYGTIEPVEGPREIATMASAFNEMVESRTDAEAKMQESERNLKALSDHLLVLQEHERTRIARELHDDLGQSLTALKMDVVGFLGAHPESAATASIRERILRTLDSTVTAVQRISAELRPSALDDLGLAAALESEARLFEERTGIECELSLDPDAAPLDGERASAVYRIMQEALTNVARHSDATRVEIRLRQRPSELLLEVRDDGRGMTVEEMDASTSLGLIGMHERAAVVGGTLQLGGVRGRGTIVTLRIPHQAAVTS